MSDHQMGWPMKGKEINMDFSYAMTDTSKGSAYDDGYKGQQRGEGLAEGKRRYTSEPDKARAWTMGWGASYADHGPASTVRPSVQPFASGGIVERVNSGRYGLFGERASEDEGQFCAIAPYTGRNWFDSIEGAVKHADKLINTHGGGSKSLIIAKAARVVSREPQPKPPLRVRHPRPHEFA